MNLNELLKKEQLFIHEFFPGKEAFHLLEGTYPILLSAPHATTHVRENKEKSGEFRTGCVVDYLCEHMNCYGIYRTKNKGDDPNFDEINPYKTACIELIKKKNIELLIDLHIMAPSRPYSIDIGTGKGKNIRDPRLALFFSDIFKKHGIKETKIDFFFTASNPNTVSATIAKTCGIHAIQIETNWKIYENEQQLFSFINALKEIIFTFQEKNNF